MSHSCRASNDPGVVQLRLGSLIIWRISRRVFAVSEKLLSGTEDKTVVSGNTVQNTAINGVALHKSRRRFRHAPWLIFGQLPTSAATTSWQGIDLVTYFRNDQGTQAILADGVKKQPRPKTAPGVRPHPHPGSSIPNPQAQPRRRPRLRANVWHRRHARRKIPLATLQPVLKEA